MFQIRPGVVAAGSKSFSELENNSDASDTVTDSYGKLVNIHVCNSEENETDFEGNGEDFAAFEFPSSSSDSEFDSESELSENSYALDDTLCEWVTKNNISVNALHALLSLLRPYHPYLPKDPRTLLKTKKQYNIVSIGGWEYYHVGVGESILKELNSNGSVLVKDVQVVSSRFNIHGLPLFKSSSTQFWPILGKLSMQYQSKPFIVGLFMGKQKPSNVDEYLQCLIEEMQQLQITGIHIPDTDNFIRAKSFVKQLKGHSGYYGFDKCSQPGVWKGKMTFPESDEPLRTDVQFAWLVKLP